MASRGVNKVILVGNLGADPEVRYMPNGGAVTNITLATSETWRDKTSGEMKEQTTSVRLKNANSKPREILPKNVSTQIRIMPYW